LLESANDGRYTIQVSDLSGRVVSVKYINVVKGNQKARVDLNSRLTKGIYVVKVTDANKAVIINEKIVLQ
jgi:methionine-rich copper-binding protein CopC